MEIPPPEALMRRIADLPAAVPLLERVGDRRNLYLVGGAVRDLLLGGQPKDLDLLVEGDPVAVAARLGEPRRYDRFNTATASVGGFTYDFAQARRERYAQPGALPDVAPATLEDDLLRRDFAVNAIALALGGEQPGAVRAVRHAVEDLGARRLRVLHDASFLDDPTRLLRLARYAARLEFAVEPHTRTLAADAIARGALSTVSGPRVGHELRLAAEEPDPVDAFAVLSELGLDRAIAPGLGLTDLRLARRALALLSGHGRGALVVLALALAGVRPQERAELVDRLAFDAEQRRVILAGDQAAALAAALERSRNAAEIADAALGWPPELMAVAGALGPDRAARLWLERLSQLALEITGADVVAAGVPAGPAIGVGLRAALRAKLDGRARGAEEELEEAVRAARAAQAKGP